jgi:hypothetical protein
VILDGVVNDDAERRRAKETIETIPGVKAVITRIRVANYAGGFAGAYHPGRSSPQPKTT